MAKCTACYKLMLYLMRYALKYMAKCTACYKLMLYLMRYEVLGAEKRTRSSINAIL